MSSSSSSTGDQSDGFPIQIFKVKNDRSLELDTEALSSVLLKPSVKDKPTVIISVAGKSFLLNFFLRFLISLGLDNWIGDPSSPLNGFNWRSGTEGDTEGILLWSEPFVVTLLNARGDSTEVAILLMDTQGVFSRGLPIKESVTVFALSTLLSSVQVFNLKNNIQENDLQSLEMFTEYGRLALKENNEKPFQKLMFLIRDWESPYEYCYGLNGGQKFLSKCLVINKDIDNDSQRVRRNISDYFLEIECFLMPHPGLNVTDKINFDGRIADVEPKFVDNLKSFVEHIFKSENLLVKKICGREVTGKELMQYFRQYADVFKSDKIPEPKTIFGATAEANNLNALITAKDLYQSSMDKVCGTEIEYIEQELLLQNHQQNYDDALTTFDKFPKIGGDKFSGGYRAKLQDEMKKMYKDYERTNTLKKSKLSEFLKSLWERINSDSVETFITGLVAVLGMQVIVPGIGSAGLCLCVLSIVYVIKRSMNTLLNIVTSITNSTAHISQTITDGIILMKYFLIIMPIIVLIVVVFNFNFMWYILLFLWKIVQIFCTVLMMLWWLISYAFTLIFRANN